MDKEIKHVICEGSREHVISWDIYGQSCSEPNCEINAKRELVMKRDEQDARRIINRLTNQPHSPIRHKQG